MKCLLSVCLAVLAGVAIFALNGRGQELQKGVSVEMATSTHAAPMPEADRESAWIVTVTADGRTYFGADPVTNEALLEQMKIHPRNRAAKLYVKADAGAPFSNVRQVLHAARVDLFDDAVLLTSQAETAQPGMVVSPKGIDVWIGNEAGSNFTLVQIDSREASPALKINNEAIAPPTLQSRLAQLFDNRTGRIVVLKASGQVPYATVVQAIDACRAAGASRVSIMLSPEI